MLQKKILLSDFSKIILQGLGFILCWWYLFKKMWMVQLCLFGKIIIRGHSVMYELSKFKITGSIINYYFICHTKVWLFSHHIQLEQEHENVKIGKELHEERYPRMKKEVTILNQLKLDFVERGDELVVHEVKKSDRMKKSHIFQMYFYLDFLQQHDVHVKGEINYPLLNKKKEVVFGDAEREKLYSVIENIKKIVANGMPSPKRKKFCKNCAYEEFCFGDFI